MNDVDGRVRRGIVASMRHRQEPSKFSFLQCIECVTVHKASDLIFFLFFRYSLVTGLLWLDRHWIVPRRTKIL